MNKGERSALHAARELIFRLEELKVDYDDLKDYVRVLRYNLKEVKHDNKPLILGFSDRSYVLELCDYWIEGHRKET